MKQKSVHRGEQNMTLTVSTSSTRLPLAAAVAFALCAGTAGAQQTDDGSLALEEVIVTATKREVRLLEVPISVSVLNGDQIATAGAVTIADLAYSVPGLTAINVSPSQQQYFLRGIAARSGLPTVGTYLDEVATGSRNSAQSTDVRPLDVERIEVLRGPQGTLFGEGSMGGTIRVITRKPQLDKFGFSFDGEYAGTEEGDPSTSLTTVANLPVVKDKFALRILGSYQDLGGWIDETVLGNSDVNNNETRMARVKGLWAPTDALEIGFMALKQKAEGDGISAGTAEGTIANTISQPFYDDYDLYNLTIDYDFGSVKFLSSTARVEREYYLAQSVEGFADLFNPPPPSPPFFRGALIDSIVSSEDFSQEFRLTSDGEGPLSWTLGAFYREFNYLDDDPVRFRVISALPGVIPDIDLLTAFADIESKSSAVFGEVSYELNDRFEATVGLRGYQDKQNQTVQELNLGLPPVTTERDEKFEALTSRVNLAYRFSRDRMLYLSASQGFRSGGFNLAAAPPGVIVPPDYDPEDLLTYEIGTKLVGAEGRLIFEGAVFYNDWSDIQTIFSPFAGATFNVTTNGGKASGIGIDWNVQYRVTDALSVALNGSYIDAQYDVTSLDKRDGDPIDFVPDLSWSLAVDYGWTLGGVPSYAKATYQYQGELPMTTRSTGTETTYSDELYFLNLRAGMKFKALDVYVFGRNLTNEDGKIDPFSSDFQGGRPRPRQFGIGVSFPMR